MAKMIVVEGCIGCPFLRIDDRAYDCFCSVYGQSLADGIIIPDWCPLPNAPQEEKDDG